MNYWFIFDGQEEDLKFYKTKDEEYSLTVRPDGFFVLYKLNKKDDAYDWVETYFHSFEECEEYMKKKGYKTPLTLKKAVGEFVEDNIEHLFQPLTNKQTKEVESKAWEWLKGKIDPSLTEDDLYSQIEENEELIEEWNTYIQQLIVDISK